MGGVDRVLEGRPRDLGGFSVRRVLPSADRRTIGPFIFFDHMGPAAFPPGGGIDVRPHPHVGLATVTYLFDGELVHRDSLGSEQTIRPGDVNWMVAGRGIVHSERTPRERRETAGGARIHGIQSWLALPAGAEEVPPSFTHHPRASLPELRLGGVSMRLIAGEAFGERAPPTVFSSLFYLEARSDAAAVVALPEEFDERAVYVVEGEIEVGGECHGIGRMLGLERGTAAGVRTLGPARLMLLGGAPLEGPRHIWWNFVSSRTERIEQAKRDWRDGRFGEVPGDPERIPLPRD
jgi:redox-sensitive bicupin YhaK (pirin superfamily)